ncbi:MAG TPA: DsbA family protein [Polyangia bacterium]|nr:DsbA family protein [Polyangia bacterium]
MSKLTPPVNEHDHLRGALSAPVKLCEFGDYQCPFCGEAYPVVKMLEETLGERLCVAFRNFPIVGSHPHALLAAQAAEAAGAQGKFWEMHDLLYENQDALEVEDLVRYADVLGLDVDQFVEDVRTQRFLGKIRADLKSGALSGVNGTPTFFVNGRRHDGAGDFETLYAVILAEMGEEEAAPPPEL